MNSCFIKFTYYIVWFTTLKAFWLSKVIKNRGKQGSILASALASEINNADMTGDNPFVKPYCNDNCSKFWDSVSNNLPIMDVTVMPR